MKVAVFPLTSLDIEFFSSLCKTRETQSNINNPTEPKTAPGTQIKGREVGTQRLRSAHTAQPGAQPSGQAAEEAAADPKLTFCIYEPLPGCSVRGGELLLDFGDIFRMQVVK